MFTPAMLMMLWQPEPGSSIAQLTYAENNLLVQKLPSAQLADILLQRYLVTAEVAKSARVSVLG